MEERKRAKVEEEEKADRISSLPDCLIHHIISLLLSTKQAIQTGILSKRWQNQWTRAPVLIFDSTGMSSDSFNKFIENTLILHNCSKLKTFHLEYHYRNKEDQFTAKIRFAIRKDVEDLKLASIDEVYMLPKFLFDKASLVKLTTNKCTFMPNGKVNWGCLTELNIQNCSLNYKALGFILRGSPLLKSLELSGCSLNPFEKLVIRSMYMKRLVFLDLDIKKIETVDISCPKLEVLSLKHITIDYPEVLVKAIQDEVLYWSSTLESFELISCSRIGQLCLVCGSLKRLVLGQLNNISHIEILCPKLEKLKIFGRMNIVSAALMDLPTSARATFDFYYDDGKFVIPIEMRVTLIKDILKQLRTVTKLKIGSCFLKILSAIEVGSSFSSALSIKSLTLNYPDFNEHHSGIACVLRNSPMLEKLVIKLPHHEQLHDDPPELNDFGEDYWKSNADVYDCLVSHLKTVQIIGYPKRDDKRKFVLNFVQFVLKNARVLEKMVLVWKDHETDFSFKVSEELLSLPRCSEYAIIELLCSE